MNLSVRCSNEYIEFIYRRAVNPLHALMREFDARRHRPVRNSEPA